MEPDNLRDRRCTLTAKSSQELLRCLHRKSGRTDKPYLRQAAPCCRRRLGGVCVSLAPIVGRRCGLNLCTHQTGLVLERAEGAGAPGRLELVQDACAARSGTMRRRTSGRPKFSLLLFIHLLLPIPAFSFDCFVSRAECLLPLLRLLSFSSPSPFASRGCGSRLADFFKIVPLRPRRQRRGQHGADGSGSTGDRRLFVCRVARQLSSRRVRASEIGPSSLLIKAVRRPR